MRNIRLVESAFEIIAEPNRRAILSLLASSEQSVGEIERNCVCRSRRCQSTCECCATPVSWSPRVDAQRRLYRLRPEPLHGGRRLAGSVPALLVRPRRCSRTPPRPHGSGRHQRKGKKTMSDREQYTPGAASWRGGQKGRRQVDAHSRPRPAPSAGEGLAGADRSGAAARVGAVRRRSEPRHERAR